MRNEIKKVFAIAMIASMAAVCRSAQVDSVLVRQQWPWNAEVRVEYVVSGATSPAAVTFEFRNGGEVVPISDATALKGDHLWAGNGTHVVTFNPRALFGPAAPNEFTAFTASVTLGAENAAMGDKLYRIVDLETGAVEDLVRGDFYNGKYGKYETNYGVFNAGGQCTSPLSDIFIWTDVTNNLAWRTTKMVFRYVPAASYGTWLMGKLSCDSFVPATRHAVQLTNDYWMGVFPVTQRQCEIILGSRGTMYTNETTFAGCEGYPVYGIAYTSWRGKTYDWTVHGHQVTSGSFLGMLRAKTGNTIEFDLPTEAQWEFASRAGQFEKELYTGLDWGKTQINRSAWNYDNSAVNGSNQPHVVGGLPPNAYGLYDTIGNMWEWCLDWSDGNDYAWTSTDTPEVDPQGVPKSAVTLDQYGNGEHIIRGGSFNASRTRSASGTRSKENCSSTGSAGARICCLAN